MCLILSDIISISILIEFYVTEHSKKVNASEVVHKLARGSYGFKLGKYHVSKVEEKGIMHSYVVVRYCNHII